MVDSKVFGGLFRKKQAPAVVVQSAEPLDEGDSTFDESCFDFSLKGGPYQTSLVEASATYKSGPNEGMPLPLHCTWYRSSDKVHQTLIEGVSGAFYQPSLEDIGCRILVHAVPASDVEEYLGMPAFQQVGPLQLDPDIESVV